MIIEVWLHHIYHLGSQMVIIHIETPFFYPQGCIEQSYNASTKIDE